MSAKKTDTLKNWLITITVIFTLSFILIFLTYFKIEGLSIQQKIEHRNQVLTATATIFVGLAVMINAYYAAKRAEAMYKRALAAEKNVQIEIKNAELNQEKLIAERFTAAIQQLGHHKIETRIGAIYALERISQDFPKEHWTIMEVLTAFVRENAPLKKETEDKTNEGREALSVALNLDKNAAKIRNDIQAALTVIGRRNWEKDSKHQKIDLRNTDIRWAELRGAKLVGADLRGANLCAADLREANLCAANLDGAKLSGTILYEANLDHASLRGTNLCWANLYQARLCGANLRGANLSDANLRRANIFGASFYKANLQQANLKLANLSGAKLSLANLQGAKLDKANLHQTGLIGAKLQQASLNGANLRQANLNSAKLQATEILFADLCEASLTETNLQQANLMGTNLERAILHEANLTGANLTGVNLCGADLCDVTLEGATLTGAKNLQSQQITSALGDRTTQLPDNVEVPIHWRKSG